MHSVRRQIKVLIILIVLLAGVCLAEQPNPRLPPSKNGIVILPRPVEFGQRLLPAGIYEFHCIHKGRYHLMAVYRVIFGSRPVNGTAAKPVAVDYCRMAPLREKVKVSRVVTERDEVGNEVINEICIQGEQVCHIFGKPARAGRGVYL